MEEGPDKQRSRQSRSEDLQRRPSLLRSSNGERNAILNSTEGRINTSRSNARWKDRRSQPDGTSPTDSLPLAGCSGSSDASVTQAVTTQTNDAFVTIKKDQELVSGVPREKLQQRQQLFPWITDECTGDQFLMEKIQELIPLLWIPKETLHEHSDTVSVAASTSGASAAQPVNNESYRGVVRRGSRSKRKRDAQISDPAGKSLWLGTFETEELAARPFDEAAIRFRGSRAVLNFPEESHAAAAAEAARASRSAISSTTQHGSSAAEGKSAAPFEVPPVSRTSTPTNPSTSSMIIHQHQLVQDVETPPLHQPNMDPVERLISTIDSKTTEALSLAVGELRAIRSHMDKLGASAPENGSRPRVGEDLASMARARLQSKTCMTQDHDTAMKRSRRMDSVALSLISPDGSDALNTLHRAGVEPVDKVFTVMVPDLKSLKGKEPLALQEEIRQINDRLIDIEVEVSYEGSKKAAAQGREGVVVTCSHKLVAVRPTLAQIETADHLFVVRFLVPVSYPQSSPVSWSDCKVPNDNFPSASGAGKILVQQMQSARDDFERELVSLPAPISLITIAECWGRYARNALAKISTYHGGGTFSTNIGVWETYA